MKGQNKVYVMSVVAVALFLAGTFLHAPVAIADDSDCSDLVTGTYLTTITNANGDFASRSILTFFGDGNLSTIDSSQGGVPATFNPFTDSQGTWQCTGDQTFVATVLNFPLPGSNGNVVGLARLDIAATVDQETQGLEGTIELRFFKLLDDPLNPTTWPTDGPFNFTFEGQPFPRPDSDDDDDDD